MVAHLVLFAPRSDLSERERTTFIEALEQALVNIPLIKRARVGRRFRIGRQYDEQNALDFPFAAILEFETEADLRTYLDHPAHDALGAQFYIAANAALVLDFSLVDAARAREVLLS